MTHVDHVFEEPPEHIQVKENSAGYRDVLSATWQLSPYYQSESIKDEKERARVIRHARALGCHGFGALLRVAGAGLRAAGLR